ncbi:MAG: hypothetical protein NXI00_24335, partial [Cytophagales bacterium]|nr:hypothetical protein [Cytophagales bacterium]
MATTNNSTVETTDKVGEKRALDAVSPAQEASTEPQEKKAKLDENETASAVSTEAANEESKKEGTENVGIEFEIPQDQAACAAAAAA